jgi:hypothetical protein
MDGHDLGDGCEFVFDLVDQRIERRADEQHLGLRIVHDVGDFRRRQAPVDGDNRGVCLRRAQHLLEERGRVLIQKGDPVLRPHALSDQTVGDARAPLVELAIGLRLPLEYQRRRVPAFARMKARHVPHRTDFGMIGHLRCSSRCFSFLAP